MKTVNMKPASVIDVSMNMARVFVKEILVAALVQKL